MWGTTIEITEPREAENFVKRMHRDAYKLLTSKHIPDEARFARLSDHEHIIFSLLLMEAFRPLRIVVDTLLTGYVKMDKLKPVCDEAHIYKEERTYFVRKNFEKVTKFKEAILEGKIQFGMNKEMVLASWGKPDKINRTVSPDYSLEQWIYEGVYLYFKNDILSTFQD